MPRQSARLRIIAGKWRRRQLTFPAVEGLRPTPDRVRETLFAWLTPVIAQSRCLDLCAGSGLLGFEALSRGAATVHFVERSAVVMRRLQDNCRVLAAEEQARFYRGDARTFLKQNFPDDQPPFDIIFVDPPFHRRLAIDMCRLLAQSALTVPGTQIYLETERDCDLSSLPHAWRKIKSGHAGQTQFRLLRCSESAS